MPGVAFNGSVWVGAAESAGLALAMLAMPVVAGKLAKQNMAKQQAAAIEAAQKGDGQAQEAQTQAAPKRRERIKVTQAMSASGEGSALKVEQIEPLEAEK